ncbi:protein OBERON 1-like, partial [Phalaenopsis equestris]|uniref:protein OBERON 1-like n=1 Tax=Phalaenopsis equestris TaxID=78828 RepID=UPI0009E44E5E
FSDAEKSCNAYKYNGSLGVSRRPGSESAVSSGGCKAGNKMCASVKKIGFQPKIKACDICCSESGFCRDCCCILCCGCVDSARGGFSFIRCQAILEKDLSCGHVAHIDCALRAYMAGTVGGSIGLDAEYYCRRCDNKTDLIQHVIKMMEICKSFDSPDDIEKVLNLGSCILFGSEKVRAKKLRYSIGTIVSKLNLGISLTDIWKAENDFLTVSAGQFSQP